jgi:hypothetical protein
MKVSYKPEASDTPRRRTVDTARRRIEEAVGVLPRQLPEGRIDVRGHDSESDRLTRAIIELAAVLEAGQRA